MSMLQMNAACVELERWLSRKEILGKSPFAAVCIGEFDRGDLHYYVFKFRAVFLGDWLLGVSGGYQGDELEALTEPNSEMKPFLRRTALQDAEKLAVLPEGSREEAEESTAHGFRPMLRLKQQLSGAECLELLQTQKRGVLSVCGDGGYPYGIPLNHWYSEEDGCLYFHCGKVGHKLDALKRSGKCSFCVMDDGERKEGDWALTFRSVVVFGKVRFVDDPEKLERVCRALSGKFTDDQAYIDDEVRRFAAATTCFALVPEHITGKRVHEA